MMAPEEQAPSKGMRYKQVGYQEPVAQRHPGTVCLLADSTRHRNFGVQ